MERFKGKVALITGAARGQGRSHAISLARQGADVIVVDIASQIPSIPYPLGTADELDETARTIEELGRRALAVKADARSQEQMDGVVAQGLEEFGQIDVLVVNHAVATFAPFWELTDDEWTDVVEVNLTGVWRVTKAVAPHMIERRSGAIVMTSTINAIEPGSEYAHYNAAKAGVISLAKNVALELGPYNVRCNCVCPGAIDTPMINWQGMYDRFVSPGAGRDDLRNALRHWVGLRGRGMLPPQSVSDAVVWLASEEAANVTGIVVPVDAGHLILPSFNHDPVRD